MPEQKSATEWHGRDIKGIAENLQHPLMTNHQRPFSHYNLPYHLNYITFP
jgi:hypothetical protein